MRVLGIDPGYAIVGCMFGTMRANRFAPVDFNVYRCRVPFE